MWGWISLKADEKSIKTNLAKFLIPSRWLWLCETKVKQSPQQSSLLHKQTGVGPFYLELHPESHSRHISHKKRSKLYKSRVFKRCRCCNFGHRYSYGVCPGMRHSGRYFYCWHFSTPWRIQWPYVDELKMSCCPINIINTCASLLSMSKDRWQNSHKKEKLTQKMCPLATSQAFKFLRSPSYILFSYLI